MVRCYPWRHDSRRYVLRSEVSDEEAGILGTVFHRRNDYLREHCLVLLRAQPSGLRQALPCGQMNPPPELRKHLGDHGWKCAEYAGIASFGTVVLKTLGRWLEAEGREGPHPRTRRTHAWTGPRKDFVGVRDRSDLRSAIDHHTPG